MKIRKAPYLDVILSLGLDCPAGKTCIEVGEALKLVNNNYWLQASKISKVMR